MPLKIYLMGSMRNPDIPDIAIRLRKEGYDAFDDWHSPGPDTDDQWQQYEKRRGRSYREALQGHHARQVFQFDKAHIDSSDVAVLVLPAGRSAHLELGYFIGCGKPGYILFDKEPERNDIMHLFATDVLFSVDELVKTLANIQHRQAA